MKSTSKFAGCFGFLSLLWSFCYAVKMPTKVKRPVIIGYVGGYRGFVDTNLVDPFSITHLNYAFVNIKEGKAFLNNPFVDSINLTNLDLLKQRNPQLQILISIGGWSWSKNFSDAVMSDSSRQIFAASAVEIIRKYQLDGVDIDWEYPGMQGDKDNVFRPEDKQHYTLMFQAIRGELDSLEIETGRKKLLTTAVGGFASFARHTEMAKVQQYLDYINLMTYDYFPDKTGRHHANLYAGKNRPDDDGGENAVNIFLAAGVPASKLVLGIPFYGRSFQMDSSAKVGLGDKVINHVYGKGFTFIKDSLIDQGGFKSYKDDFAKAPYLFNSELKMFITYDDEWSVNLKCKYVLYRKLAGVMFWEYDDDKKGYLLHVINEALKQ